MESTVNRIMPALDRALFMGSAFHMAEEDSKSVRWVGVIDRDGSVLYELGEKVEPVSMNFRVRKYDETESFWPWSRVAMEPGGQVFRAPDRDRWKLERYDLAGDRDLTVQRDIPPRKRTDEQLAEMEERFARPFKNQSIEFTGNFAGTYPACNPPRVVNGQIWVSRFTTDDEQED